MAELRWPLSAYQSFLSVVSVGNTLELALVLAKEVLMLRGNELQGMIIGW